MANSNRAFARKRIMNQTAAAALGYQSQGSYPDGNKNVLAYSLRSTLHFADLTSSAEVSLFGAPAVGTPLSDTNVQTANQIPNGRSLLVQQIDFYQPSKLAGLTVAQFNAYVQFLRDTVFTFARNNSDFDAQFAGYEVAGSLLQILEGTPSVAGNQFVRVGDMVKPLTSFKLRVPVVLGQNVTFQFVAKTKAALGGANPLVAAALDMPVGLRGLLTKVST